MPAAGPGWDVHTIVQYDHRGDIVFQQRCQDKWKFAGNRFNDSLRKEQVCFDLVADLKMKWDGVLWNAAADVDLVPYPRPRRIRRPKCPELLIECYSVDEAKALLQAASRLDGAYPSGVKQSHYWPAAIRLAWDTGFRRSDVWGFKKSSIGQEGAGRIVQRKTRRAISFRLRESTIHALDAIPFDQPLRWEMDMSYFGRHFKRLVKAAGVNRGTFKWLRRASGSYVEKEMAGAGGKHLGHSDPRMFNSETSYHDAKSAAL